MRISSALIVATLAIGTVACGGRTNTTFAPAVATVTSANITFFNRDDGKDANSVASIELLRNNVELGADARAVGTHFEHDTVSAPIAMSMTGPFRKTDVADGRLRIRLTPDGRDSWSFDTRMTLFFSDGTSESFRWNQLRLDNDMPERTLPLQLARIP